MIPQTPRGMRDIAPYDARKRGIVIDTIRDIFERFGFDPMQSPAVEAWETLAGKGGEEVRNEIYYFKDKSDRELGLRFDLTVPLARFVASNPQLTKPFKRYHVGRVWRYDRPQAGRYREFWQADIDIVGSSSMYAEAECLAVACAALRDLGFRDFEIRLNNRKLLNGFLYFLKIPEKSWPNVLRTLDKLEKIGAEGVLAELKAAKIGKEESEKIMKFVSRKGSPSEFIKEQRKEFAGFTMIEEALDELEEIYNISRTYGTTKWISIDFSLVRGLDYYTGPVFEVSIKSKRNLGSVAGGGRYDSLIERFGGRWTPMVGISFGIERLMEIVNEDEMVDIPQRGTKCFVVAVDDSVRKDCIKIAEKLRKGWVNAETDVMGRDMKKQLEYANKAFIPYALIVGKKELNKGVFILKEMKTGKQANIRMEKLLKFFANAP